MKRYSQIKNAEGVRLPSSTLKGLKQLAKKGRVKEGTYSCVCPSGSILKFELKSIGTHVCAGNTVRKTKVGKGANIPILKFTQK